jgi:hypothetical protein
MEAKIGKIKPLSVIINTDKSAQRVSKVFIFDHVNLDAPHQYRAVYPHRNMVRIVRHPHRHFLPVLEYGSGYQKGRYFNGIKGPVFCLDPLLAQIPDVKVVYLFVQEHAERNSSAFPIAAVVYIPGVING